MLRVKREKVIWEHSDITETEAGPVAGPHRGKGRIWSGGLRGHLPASPAPLLRPFSAVTAWPLNLLVAFLMGQVPISSQLFSCLFFSFLIRNRPEGKVLETVGVFEVPKQNGKYETGQVSAGLGHLSFSRCALLKGSVLVPECYGFLPWCLVLDQNHKFLKMGFCFPGCESFPWSVGSLSKLAWTEIV